jgi:hypothetical protein
MSPAMGDRFLNRTGGEPGGDKPRAADVESRSLKAVLARLPVKRVTDSRL